MAQKEQKRLYTDEQIDEALRIVWERTEQVIKILGDRANLIAYLIKPGNVAIGASLEYNFDVFKNAFYENVVRRDGLAYDGNAGYTLLDMAKMIKDKEL